MNYQLSHIALLGLTLCTLSTSLLAKGIDADDSLIRYTGRLNQTDPKAPKFDWSGTRISASFSGTNTGASFGIRLKDQGLSYVVYINGIQDTVLVTDTTITEYTLTAPKPDSAYTVEIIRKNEGHGKPAIFYGFTIDESAQLLALPTRPTRRMEFIGASWTGGYGTESASRTCTAAELKRTTNIDKSFGSNLARMYNAEPTFVQWSGKGMVRNYGDQDSVSISPLPLFYSRRLSSNPVPMWDFSSWIPDIVVIQLGGNDFSTMPHPSETAFKSGYFAFIDSLQKHNPFVSIICLGSSEALALKYTQEIVTARQALGQSVYYMSMPTGLAKTGCDWHPNIADHEKIATAISAVIDANDLWTPKPLHSIPLAHAPFDFSIRYTSTGLQIVMSDFAKSSIAVFDLTGKKVGSAREFLPGIYSLSMEQYSHGTYLLRVKTSTGLESSAFHW